MHARLVTLPLAAAVILAGCSGDADAPDTTASATTTSSQAPASPTSQTDASIDVDSDGDPSADAQDAEGAASLGTAAATIAVTLPDHWQYEGTYGDGALPYAVLVDASQPFDLSEPGSDAYRDSVWVQVETYREGEPSPLGDAMPDDADALADQIADVTGGDTAVVDGTDVPVVYAAYDADGAEVKDLYALHDDLWILARPSNVDVEGWLDGGEVPILTAVLERSEIK